MANELTKAEAKELRTLEKVVEEGLETFMDVGIALAKIKDSQLYREVSDTFEKYCQERFCLGKAYANRLMRAAQVMNNLLPTLSGTSPIGDEVDNAGRKLPETESQARPLADLPPEEQGPAWKEAVETAPNGKITANHVQAVVKDRKAKTEVIEGPKDSVDQLIPAGLVPVFEKAGEFKKIVSALNEINRQLVALKEHPAGAHMRLQAQQIDLKNLKESIHFDMPYAVCPVCSGRAKTREANCPCKGKGWLIQVSYKNLPSEFRQ